MSTIIEEALPPDPLSAEVVLHVRRHLRTLIRQRGTDAAHALALLFGFPWEEGDEPSWRDASKSPNPFQAAAASMAARSGAVRGAVVLGHDFNHIERCKVWLEQRVRNISEFNGIVADDLATLLAMSTAADLALASPRGSDDRQGGYLPILIQGETGTGKEMLAKAIHDYWSNQTHPNASFHIVQIAGVSPELIYSELFGAVKGAYTGAVGREGRLEVADGGTLLIDEVGDLPLEAQVALLRFLQTGEILRLGASKPRHVHVRILAATWHDLDQDVKEGGFRLDLLHRIRGAGAVVLPPLRSRRPLVGTVSALLGQRGFEPRMTYSVRAATDLYEWPGNLRELVSVLDAALSVAGADDVLRVEHLPVYLQRDYLARPLEQRAIGLLCDVFDDGPLSEAAVAVRVELLTNAVMQGFEAPETEVSRFLHFLSQIRDVSSENAAAVQSIEAAISDFNDGARHQAAVEFWQRVGSAGLPSDVLPRVEEQVVNLQAHVQQAYEKAMGSMNSPMVTENVWLGMLRELMSSPLFSDAPAGAVASFLLGGQGFLAHHFPGFLDEAKGAYQQDRFSGVFRLLARKFEEISDSTADSIAKLNDASFDEEEPLVLERKRPRDLSRDEWIEIATLPALCDAEDMTGFSPKTIRKYLDGLNIDSRWNRQK